MTRSALGRWYPLLHLSRTTWSSGTSRCHSQRGVASANRPPRSSSKPKGSGEDVGSIDWIHRQIGYEDTNDYTTGLKVRELSRKFNIHPPIGLRLIKGQNFEKYPVRVSVCKQHTFSMYHMKYLGPTEQPLTDKFISFYAAKGRRDQPLWCYVQRNANDETRVVVQSTAGRRVRAAFIAALRINGYDKFGRPLPQESDGEEAQRAAGGDRNRQLYGTIRLNVFEPKKLMQLDFQELVNYLAEHIKKRIEPTLGTGGGAGERSPR
ncbi:hypothetical protein QBC46DRAFT_390317 [Diplogelasinospora grovesii]|uniref:Uncharacterized protein n=1 Tax=Diplogelasinospora grovesii TaxID=303347 RepID=A0AAN6S3F4_9PEZI|nr:hypothetical protein QBC46DRAFT_390317 [Diplogelasinospora grovesii]